MIARISLLALLAYGPPLAAQSVKLQAHEIEALLTGNTAVGKWDGATYRQFFDTDGTTIYAQEGARSARGEWRVDPTRDEYQSIWPRDADWEGWFVMEYAGDFYWVSKATPPTPFKVLEGQQLVAVSQGGSFCEGLATLGEAGAPPDQSFALPSAVAQQTGCKTSLNLDGETSLHCSWTFPYRATAATRAFKSLVAQMRGCDAKSVTQDEDVNHPDSYDLRLYDFLNSQVGISLKDKGALQQTLVFLTVTHR